MNRLEIFPLDTKIAENHLIIGDCDTVELAGKFETPLYVFDEKTLRSKCREYIKEFTDRYPDIMVNYAAKAFINREIARLLKEEGIGLDVVSGGELSIANSVSFPMKKVFFPGNNKSAEELELALRIGVGHIVVDNFHELSLLNLIAAKAVKVQNILLRISPGVDAHTMAKTTTGIVDSKFGFDLTTGQAEEAVAKAMETKNVKLVGLHCHIGSQIFEMEPYEAAIEIMIQFAADMKHRYGFEMKLFSPGGGLGIQYVVEAKPPGVAEYAQSITAPLIKSLKKLDLPMPGLIVEPGRSIIGQAGVALYTVGAIKNITGVRKYVSVDGGMADNIRPAIYGSRYEAMIANKAALPDKEVVTICGKYCESGDILIKDINLPELEAGDIVAIPASGAYCIPMASNYNSSLKPAVVMVNNGRSRLIRRRETYDDLMRCDV
ncbi:MAG: diaminopimelate decarboxylase [Chloroflexi bacterium]|nr:diaminopimelate decarboxylase [Chloroflexota bacterium]